MDIWEKIKRHQGEPFYTARGLEFKYSIVGEKLYHTRSDQVIRRADFEKAVQMNPGKASDLHNDVWGPSYVFAIITDPRIK